MAFNWRTIHQACSTVRIVTGNGQAERRKPMAGRLTTHVLDTATGKPAAGLSISLYRIDGDHAHHLKTVVTNADGRCDAPLLEGAAFRTGEYELVFARRRLSARGRASNCPSRPSSTSCRSASAWPKPAHYHVPLLVSPYGYSTYGGAEHGQGQYPQRDPLHPQWRGRRARRRRAATRRCSTICGSTARCAAPRKAAPKAIAAPARCWSAGCAGGELVYESVNACIRFVGSLDGTHVVTDRASARRATAAASGAAGDGRFPWLAMRLLHAGLRHVALWPVDARRRTRRTRRSKRRCRAISAAAPAMSRSCARRRRSPATARRRRIRWRRSARRSRRRLAAMHDGARVEIGAGKDAADRAGHRRRSRRGARQPSPSATSSPARPMSASG